MLSKIKNLLFLFIPFLGFFFVSNVSAASLNSVSFDMYYKVNEFSSYIWDNNLYYQAPMTTITQGGGFLQYRINTGSVTAQNSNAVLHFETNIVVKSKYDSVWSAWYHLPEQELITCVPSVSGITITQKNLSYAVTNWTHIETGPQPNDWFDSTLTLYGTIAMRGFTSGQSVYFTCAVGSNNYSMLQVTNPVIIYLEQNPMTIDWSDNQTDNLLYYQINQSNTYYESNYSAVTNIGNQSSSDISGAENQQTTNLIGFIGSFITVLNGFSANNNCNLDVPFPNFMGGTVTTDICQGKDLFGNTINIISSVVLIMFFIPLAFKLIEMIYGEIRSWTNG